MTPADLRASLSALNMSQGSLARKLGVDPNTVSRWAVGAIPVPRYAEAYLRLAADAAAVYRGMDL